MAPAETVLTRKLHKGGVARSPLADIDLILENFARGLEDRLRPLLKTMVTAETAPLRVCRLADATKPVAVPALLGLVEVEDSETPALIAARAELAWHLTDLTLGGDPAAAAEPVSRPLSAIDMALLRLHLDAFLAAFIAAIGVGMGRPITKRIGIRDQRQNIAQLRFAPDYIDVLVFDVTLLLGDAGRRGEFSVILPLSALDVIRASVQQHNAKAARERPDDLWKTLMRRAAAAATVPVDAVLHRQRLTLARLEALAVGDILEIPKTAIDEIRLTIPQPAGRTALLAQGRLGAFKDNKVIKLTSAPDPRVSAHVTRALNAAGAGRPGAVRDEEPRPPKPESGFEEAEIVGAELQDIAPRD